MCRGFSIAVFDDQRYILYTCVYVVYVSFHICVTDRAQDGIL